MRPRDEQSALEAFLTDYRGKTELNRKILDHLLHDAFSDDRQTQAEVDLVLDPIRPPSGSRRSWAAIASATCGRRIAI